MQIISSGGMGTVFVGPTLEGDGKEATPVNVKLSTDEGNQLASHANGLYVPVTITISIFKDGSNGLVNPQILPAYTVAKTITSVQLASNCADIDVTVDGVNYNATTLIGVTIPANSELIINDMTIVARETNANAIITL